MESPDLPWAKNNDSRSAPKPIDQAPDSFSLTLLNFIKSKGINRGQVLEIEGENIANMNLFYSNHFEPCVMSPNEKFDLNLDQYGIKFYCYSPFSYWPFEDGHFILVIDFHTLFSNVASDSLEIYFENISRTLISGGFAALTFETKDREKFKIYLSKFDPLFEKDLGNEIFVFRKK